MQKSMDEKPKKRAWFQYHLPTAVVLMFVAGGLMWANTVRHVTECWHPFPGGLDVFIHEEQYGWPCCCYSWGFSSPPSTISMPWFTYKDGYSVSVSSIVLNAFVALAVLLAVAIALEWLIRRKSAKAEASEHGPN